MNPMTDMTPEERADKLQAIREAHVYLTQLHSKRADLEPLVFGLEPVALLLSELDRRDDALKEAIATLEKRWQEVHDHYRKTRDSYYEGKDSAFDEALEILSVSRRRLEGER
jgi:hypothetical protein